MPSEKRPHELIRDLFAERASWSDADVIAEIEQLPPLADEGDPAWNDETYWSDFASRYVALSDVAAARQLRPAVRLLLERACNGDPGEMMRGFVTPGNAFLIPTGSRSPTFASSCPRLNARALGFGPSTNS